MRCPACQYQNDADVAFCEECGSKLEIACQKCGRSLDATKKFCGGCGTPNPLSGPSELPPSRTVADYTPKHLADKILTSRSALEGECKRVTVMFADVKGSMELAAQLGAEGWHEVLDRFFAILGEGVHRYEGTINQYTGDGIMALFGAPIAHEDDAQRACYAAIQLRDHLKDFADRLRVERGVDFGVRIGINSGEVIVGKIGDDLRMDYTAQGHTVGLAQRIEQMAAPGRVYLSENTQRLVEGFFTLRNLGASRVSGADDPIGIYELEGASSLHTRLDVARARGLTRFVGRGDETRTLEAALERAREGHGQVVGVVGEPGVGKSRLCFEFIERCRSDGTLVIEAHCPAHGKNIPLIPILELYRGYFGVGSQDTPAQARQKIAGAVVLLDPELQDTLPILFDFMGVADPSQPGLMLEADARQRRLFALMRQFYRILAERDIPAVIYFDDVHWIDPASDVFLAQIVEAVAENSRTLLLLNFRPEYEAPWMRRAHYQQMPLVPLGTDALHELVESLLGRDVSVTNLADRIMHWTAGNPFYTEEVVNELVEAGHLEGSPGLYKLMTDVDELHVPANVHSVLAARIDRLLESAKLLLQAASVIGKVFTGPVLEAVDELSAPDRADAVERLKSGDFIFESALYPDVEYAFKHPLTHEVAYASLLQSRRARLHAVAAKAIEARAGDKLDEQSPLLAYHWDAANEPAQAIEWHRRAAEWCQMSDARGGMRHWQRVRDLVHELPDDKETLALGARACAQSANFRWRMGASKADIDRDFEEGKAFAEQAGDMSMLALLYGAYSAGVGVSLGNASDYLKYVSEAIRYADMTEDDELKFAERAFLQSAYLAIGDWAKVHEVAVTTPGLYEVDDLYGYSYIGSSPRLMMLSSGSNALLHQGRTAEGDKMSADAANFLDVGRFQETSLWAHYENCHLSVLYGDPERAMTIAQNMVAEFDKVQTALADTLVNLAVGEASLALGESHRAVECLGEAVRIAEDKTSGRMLQGAMLALLSKAHLALGQSDEALRYAIAAVEFCRPRQQNIDLQPWLALADVQTKRGNQAAALEALEETRQLIDKTGAIIYQPFLHESRAAFAEAFECEWSAADEIREAHRLFVELGADGHVQRVARLL